MSFRFFFCIFFDFPCFLGSVPFPRPRAEGWRLCRPLWRLRSSRSQRLSGSLPRGPARWKVGGKVKKAPSGSSGTCKCDTFIIVQCSSVAGTQSNTKDDHTKVTFQVTGCGSGVSWSSLVQLYALFCYSLLPSSLETGRSGLGRAQPRGFGGAAARADRHAVAGAR